MQALVYVAPRVMAMRDLDVPAVGPGDALVRVAYSGICGSELSGFLGQSSIRQPPLVFGHEVSGHIAATGPGVDRWDIGTPVTVNPLISCGACRYCEAGRPQLCPRRLLLGASLPGCNAEYVRVPASALLAVPERTALTAAAMVEPVAFALNAVGIGLRAGAQSALVVGAGAIGLFILQVLAEFGVESRFVVERHPDRLALAEAMGSIAVNPGDGAPRDLLRALTDGFGVDVAFDAVGSGPSRRASLASVGAGGTLVLAGLHSDVTELPLNSVIRSEITLAGAFAYTPQQFSTALDWIAAGRVGLRNGVEQAPLVDGQVWYERLVEGDPVAKVLLEP
jgi:2-desacetyl-2-hydroxyethyl bacteriochlorophyllide A dehydrogenase